MRPKPRTFTAPAALAALLSLTAALPGVTAHAASALANALYVATNGYDSNAGTLSAPLGTIQRAVDLAPPGSTILIRSGTYAPTTNIHVLKWYGEPA